MKSYSYKISYHKFVAFPYEIKIPISTFKGNTYFFAISEKCLHENVRKTLGITQNLFKN